MRRHWLHIAGSLGPKILAETVRGYRPPVSSQGPDRRAKSMMVAFQYDNGAAGALYYSREVPSLLRGLRVSKLFGRSGIISFDAEMPRLRAHSLTAGIMMATSGVLLRKAEAAAVGRRIRVSERRSPRPARPERPTRGAEMNPTFRRVALAAATLGLLLSLFLALRPDDSFARETYLNASDQLAVVREGWELTPAVPLRHETEPRAVLSVLAQSLELLRAGKPARLTQPKDEEEARVFAQAQLLTAKPVLYVSNVAEADAATGRRRGEVDRVLDREPVGRLRRPGPGAATGATGSTR